MKDLKMPKKNNQFIWKWLNDMKVYENYSPEINDKINQFHIRD